MKMDAILRIENLCKSYDDITVLQDVCASVERGSVTAFIGPNGAGKTTLFHAVSGDLAIDSGTVQFNRKRLNGKPPWQAARLGLGKLFQDVRIFPGLTVLENVLLSVHHHSKRSLPAALSQAFKWQEADAKEKKKTEHYLSQLGIEEPWDRTAGELSFGNQKLLALARLIAGEFTLLLLDEPTAGLAPAMVQNISAILCDIIREDGISIALIEHNYTFVKQMAEEVYLLQAGRMVDSGPTAAVLSKKSNREMLIGL